MRSLCEDCRAQPCVCQAAYDGYYAMAADPTPPAAPRPCECGHDESKHVEREDFDGYPPFTLCEECYTNATHTFKLARPRPVSPEAAPPPKRTFTMKVRMSAPTKGQPMPYDDDAEAAPPRATISVREEVRADVVAHLKDMRRGQPLAHQIVYDEILEVVIKAELHHVTDFGRDY